MFLPRMSGAEADLDRGGDCRAGGDADRDAFDAGAEAGVVEGLFVGRRDHLVIDLGVEDRAE